MAQVESNAGRAERSSQPNPTPPEFAAAEKKFIMHLDEMRTDLFEKLQEANRSWLDRLQAEASLASELGVKLTGTRSVPETITACQEWANRRMEMATEDVKHLLSDTQMFTETGVRLLSSGWPSDAPGRGK
jgi:hypothetical protein